MLHLNILGASIDVSALWKLLGICALCSAVIAAVYALLRPTSRKNLRQLALVFFLSAALTSAPLILLNQLLDTTPVEQISYEVLSKDSTKSGRHRRTYCFDVSSEIVEDSSVGLYIDRMDVPMFIYHQAERGDTLLVSRFEGALGIPFTRMQISE